MDSEVVSKAKSGDEDSLKLVFRSSLLLQTVSKVLQRDTELGTQMARLEQVRVQIECAGKSGKVAQAFTEFEAENLTVEGLKVALVGANQVQGLSEEVGAAAASAFESLCVKYSERGFGDEDDFTNCTDSVLALIPKAVAAPYKNIKEICTSARLCTGLAAKLDDLGASVDERIKKSEGHAIALDFNKAILGLKL